VRLAIQKAIDKTGLFRNSRFYCKDRIQQHFLPRYSYRGRVEDSDVADTKSFQPWTWKNPEGAEEMRRRMIRQDGHERVSGQAIFTRDIHLPGMLYAKVLTSPFAHGRITRMDTAKAESLMGVRDILRYDDPDIATDNVTGCSSASKYNILTLPGTGDFYQHPMGVAVVADSEEICDRALRLVQIEWEEKPFVLDMEESLKPDAPKIMSEVKRLDPTAKEPNTVLTDTVEIGDIEKGFAEADTIIEYKIKRAVNSPAGVEPMVCVAQWRGDFLDLWVHHQHNMADALSSESVPSVAFDLVGRDESNRPQIDSNFKPATRNDPHPPFAHWSKITLTFPYQGSSFGGISWLAYSYAFIRLAIRLAKRAAGKPVKLLYDESNFYCGGDESGTFTCKVGAKKDGTITAYHWNMVGVRNPAPEKTHDCTAIRNIRGTQQWALTNRGFTECFRHGAQSCVPHNIMFDRVSAELGLDPTEVALKNDGCNGNSWDWVTQYQKENGFPQRRSLKEVLELGKREIDWDRKWHSPGTKRLANQRMHGMGFMSVNEWGVGLAGILAPGLVCLILREGKVAIVGSRCDSGIDSESGFRQCVASEMGLQFEDTVLQERESDNNTYFLSEPGGSFGTISTVPQLAIAARELKQKVLHYAIRERPRGGIAFPGQKIENLDIKDSMVFEKTNPANKKTVAEVATPFWTVDPAIVHPVAPKLTGLTSGGKPDSRLYFMSRQAHFIEVEVDEETGEVVISRIVCVNDVGNVFNPKGAEGQQYGGAVMGLGRSATEEKIYCPKTGVGLNYDHIGYHLGTMNDYPIVRGLLHETHLGYSTYGSCGIGENVGAALSAITAGAIYNAIGKWILDFPITPDKVLKALGKI
jgi:CO/xanthine dehydrogenase Mo-binding subunit